MTRALRRLICQTLVGVLLFAQLAIASYACPAAPATAMQQMAPATDEAGDASMQAAGGCDQMPAQMDQASPNLCVEHCHTGQQSADHVAAPAVSPALLTSLYTLPPTPQPAWPSGPPAASLSALVAASPPHAILHCCLRV